MAITAPASAQGPDLSGGKFIDLVRAEVAPEIDGVLDDAVWANADGFDDFHQIEPNDKGVPTERTQVRILFDDDALYIAVEAFDSAPEKIKATQLAQGKSITADDRIQVILDPFLSRRTGYSFSVNPNGVRREGLFEKPYMLNEDWTGIWQSAARIVSGGWVAEIKIPFKTINFDPSLDDWGFSVSRVISRKQEVLTWSSHNGRFDPSNAGLVKGIKGVSQGLGLDIIPSMAFKLKHTNGSDDLDFDTVPSMDIFYKLTPSFTTVLTLNTDFSATDVDDRKVNLSRDALFFPEKRAFFLQDSDIFAFSNIEQNGLPFFSRKIGLSEDGTPVNIRAGIKATGRIGRWNLGLLDVLQAEQPGVKQSNLLVARASANILAESTIGAIVTNGDPLSDDDNTLVGTDLNYRSTSLIKGKSVEANSWYQMSSSEGLDQDNQAWGASLGVFARKGLLGEFAYSHIEENFNPALGFVNRSGVSKYALWSSYMFRPRGSWIRVIRPSFYFVDLKDMNNKLLTRYRVISPFEIETQAGDKARLRLARMFDIGAYSVEDVYIPYGRYVFNKQELWYQTSQSRPVSAEGTITIGDFYDGHRTGLDTTFQWRASTNLFLAAGLNYNDIKLPGGEFITRVASARVDMAFNSRWAWLNLVQYDNSTNTAALNSRLRWTPEAGKEMFLVVNYGADIDDEGMIRSRQTELVAKFGHTFRF
jgi:hypothetical protein